jgi:hypothetical protein
MNGIVPVYRESSTPWLTIISKFQVQNSSCWWRRLVERLLCREWWRQFEKTSSSLRAQLCMMPTFSWTHSFIALPFLARPIAYIPECDWSFVDIPETNQSLIDQFVYCRCWKVCIDDPVHSIPLRRRIRSDNWGLVSTLCMAIYGNLAACAYPISHLN